MLSKDKLIADPAISIEGDSVVAFMRDGAGNSITSTGGSLNANITNASIAVTSTNLDIRDLAFATDKVDVSGSAVSITGTVAVTQSTSPWIISATDLDTRDLTHVSDSVKIGDGTDFLAVNADGSINVVGSFSINGQYAEDSAHASGNTGLYNLAVRADAPAVATSADGDYASQTVDAYNRSWVNTGANVSMSAASVTVTDTSALLVAAAAGRREILIQNLQNKAIYIGPSGVSATSGIRVASGAALELEVGPAIAIHAVGEASIAAGNGTRVMQLA